MGRKRARSAGDRKLSSKRVKQQCNLKLEDLPAEIIDNILSHIIDVPNRPYHAQRANFAIGASFLAPVARTSRLFRQRTFDLIRRECLWIKLKITSREGIKYFGDIADFLPLLPHFLWTELQPVSSVFELELEGCERRVTRQTSCNDEAENTFIFPYNFDSFCHVCHWIRDESMDGFLHGLIVRYHPTTVVPRCILDRGIIPALLSITEIGAIEFEIPEEFKPRQDMTFRTWLPIRASDVLKMAKTTLEAADQFEADGHHTEAGLKLLYSFWLIEMADEFLPGPSDWHAGEQEDDISIGDTNPFDSPPARNVIGNQLRQALHQIEYRACLAHTRLYEANGPGWVTDHERVFGRMEERWVTDPSFTWFGLYPFELAQVHHARAMATRVFTSIDELYAQICSAVVSSRHEDIKWRVYSIEGNKCAADEMALACWLQRDNAEFEKQYMDMTVDLKDAEIKARALLRLRIERDDNGNEVWRGDSWMYEEWEDWAGPSCMDFLPLARKGLNNPDALPIQPQDHVLTLS